MSWRVRKLGDIKEQSKFQNFFAINKNNIHSTEYF